MKAKEQFDHDFSKALECNGAFFAFSTDQFNASKQEGIEYASIDYGLICPKDKAEILTNTLQDLSETLVRQDIAENGIDNIILRELYNHEAFYTGEIEDTYSAIAHYDITLEQVYEVYRDNFHLQE